MKIAIITDTNSGITKQEADRLGIFLLPMPIIIEDKCYLEGIDIQTEDLYRAMEEGKNISTSQPSPEAVTGLWDTLLNEGYEEILHIPMTSGLSGSCQTAVMLALEYTGRVFVVDNHRVSVTQREAVLEAVRMTKSYCSAEIKNYLEATALRASIYLTVESLKYLQRGGRLSSSAAVLGTLLNIKPVLSIQGERVEAFAKMRGMKKCEHKMFEAIQEDILHRFADAQPDSLRIQTAGSLRCQEDIDGWKLAVQEAFPEFTVDYFPLPCSLITHLGPDCLGIAVSVSEH